MRAVRRTPAVLEATDAFYDLARALRNWQLLAFALVAGNVVLGTGFARLALAARVVPYIVEVDAQGQAVFAGPLAAADTPEERLILQQLRHWIWHLRLVAADPRAQEELVARAYALADLPVRRQLDRYFSRPENDPRLLAARLSRSVEGITLLRLPGTEDTYQVQWREVTLPRVGPGPARERTFQGLLTVERVEQLDPETLTDNPLGLLIREFTWTETTSEQGKELSW